MCKSTLKFDAILWFLKYIWLFNRILIVYMGSDFVVNCMTACTMCGIKKTNFCFFALSTSHINVQCFYFSLKALPYDSTCDFDSTHRLCDVKRLIPFQSWFRMFRIPEHAPVPKYRDRIVWRHATYLSWIGMGTVSEFKKCGSPFRAFSLSSSRTVTMLEPGPRTPVAGGWSSWPCGVTRVFYARGQRPNSTPHQS